MERRRVSYSGRVQGVGFRARAERVARGHAVAGWVRNLPDGRVELVAQGEPAALRAFLDAVEREMGTKIREVAEEVLPADAPMPDGFSIRY